MSEERLIEVLFSLIGVLFVWIYMHTLRCNKMERQRGKIIQALKDAGIEVDIE